MNNKEIVAQMGRQLNCTVEFVKKEDDLYGDGITALCENDFVTHISISGNIIDIPFAITKLSGLKVLDISGTKIGALPEWIEKLSNLEVLNIWQTDVKELPDEIGYLFNLRELHIGQTDISKLPETIGYLSNLELLHFNHTKITELPESIGDMAALKSINAHGSRINYLPESLGNLLAMESLLIYYMPLKKLPDSIGNLTKLKCLWIQQTSISELPDSIVNLTELEDFRFDYELQKGMPESLKANFCYNSYLDFFTKKCKFRELFACQIFFKDNTLQLIENDLEMLKKVDEQQILRFKGIFQSFTGKWKPDDFPDMVWYESVDWNWQDDYGKVLTVEFSYGHHVENAESSPIDSFLNFGLSFLYDLIEKEGIAYEIVETLIPQLYRHYDAVLNRWPCSYDRFSKKWEHEANKFKECCGVFEEASSDINCGGNS